MSPSAASTEATAHLGLRRLARVPRGTASACAHGARVRARATAPGRFASCAGIVAVTALVAASGAFAQAPPPIAPDSLTLERLPLDEADLLTRADARAAQGRFDDASEVYLLLLDMAWGPLADAIVEVPGQPDLFEGLAPAIRRRLARWPARGLATWRARVDGKAKGLYEHALATADEAAREAALEEVCRRFPFAEASANAALRRADDALEQGDLATALSRIALARAYGATAEAERRQAVVERALGAARPPAAPAHGWLPAPAPGRAGPPGDPVPGPGLEATPPPGWRRTDLASSRPGASSRSAPALAGVVGLRAPYRLGVAHLRGVALLREDGAPRLIPPGAGRVDAGTSIIRLGAAETSSALIASVPSEVASAGAAPPHRAAAAAGVSGRASAVQRRRDRLLDAQLMAFDLERDGALVWSTADPERFGEDAAAWLGAVLWCGGVDARYGAVAASGLAPRAALEVVLAGFDARRPHLRWRRFICAAGQPRREHELTHAPRVAIAGHVAVLDSGLGVRAGVDVVTGEVLWLRMPTTYAPADPLAPRTQVVYPRAPALFAPSPAVAFGRVVSEDRVRGLVEGLDAATGAVVWRASSAGWSAGLVGGCGEWVALVDPDGLWLVDVRTGRALTAKLPLPPDVSVSSAVAGAGRFLAVPISKGPREAFSDLLILEVVEVFEAIGVAGKPAALALELVGAFEAPSGGAGPAILHDGALAYLAGPDAIVHPPAREAARGDLSPLGHAVGLYRVEVDGMVAARTLRSLGRWARLVEGVSRARVRRERGEVHLVLDAARERTVAVVRRADGSLGVRVAPANGSERAESTAPGGWGTGADRRPPRKAVPTTTRPRYED